MDSKVISFDNIKVACKNCSLSVLCLPMGLTPEDVDRLNAIVKRNHPMHRGDYLFRSNEPFHNLYAVKTGSVKTFIPNGKGAEQVLGFHLPGELIGLSAIEGGTHLCSAKVLETAAVCAIPFGLLEELSATIPSLQHQMYCLLSKEIGQETGMLTLLGGRSAEEKLAAFLLSLSDRFKQRGFSSTDFYLSMSRHEIGSYLGLAVETVSRLFTRFQEEGLLQVERKHVQLMNHAGLKNIYEGNLHSNNKRHGT